jgi:hypothetical protein
MDRKGGSAITGWWWYGGFQGEEVKPGFTQFASFFMVEATGVLCYFNRSTTDQMFYIPQIQGQNGSTMRHFKKVYSSVRREALCQALPAKEVMEYGKKLKLRLNIYDE